jgi:hypothetical protein
MNHPGVTDQGGSFLLWQFFAAFALLRGLREELSLRSLPARRSCAFAALWVTALSFPPMHLTFLGTSAACPTVERNTAGLALAREGETIIFDCGEGTQRR